MKPVILSLLVLGLLLAVAGQAHAQDPYGPGISPGFGPSPPPSGGKGKGKGKAPQGEPADGEPEFHAATGGSDSLIPEGEEPSLPKNPLSIKKSVLDRIGSDLPTDHDETGRDVGEARYSYLPPLYFSQVSGRYRLRTLFPLWVERTKLSLANPTEPEPDRASVFGGLYYQRRSPERTQDVVFPLIWNLHNRQLGERTTVIGPIVNRVTPRGKDNWLLPFVATGRRERGGYTLVPPLLTYTQRNARGGLGIVGPGFCRWSGGPHCDARTAAELSFGVAPVYFYKQTERKKRELIPPLLHYYGYDDTLQSYTNVWGAYFRRHTQRSRNEALESWDMFHLIPFYWSLWGPHERHTTILPFFHYGRDRADRSFLFVNPLFLQARGDEGQRTLVTWGYARHRGRTQLDMITPLYWHHRDPDVGIDERILFPFLYSRTSPRETTQAFFPFWLHSEREAIKETTWVTPFVQHTTHLRGWTTNIHPLLYLARDGYQSHTIISPFFWDFVGRESRTTIAFPAYWRFSDRETVTQMVGNVYYRERKIAHGLKWQLHLFPVFSYGETPDGHWWNLLYGLAGFTRRGELVKVRAAWIPITLHSDPAFAK